MKASTLLMTCEVCPSQWEGKLDDGRMFYIRYRWGSLSVRVSRSITNDVDDAVLGESVLEVDHDNDWDGYMSTKDMQNHTSHVLDWSNIAV